MKDIEFENVSYVCFSFLVVTFSILATTSMTKTTTTVYCLLIFGKSHSTSMLPCMFIISFSLSELIDSSIIDAIDGTMSFEQNSPFPSSIKVLTMQDYQRLLHSLYLKRPSPDNAFSHIHHFNAKHHLQNRVIHIAKPIGNSSTKRSFDYPLVNTQIGIIPLSFVQTPVESAQLRCCGFVSVPLYELESTTPIQLQLPEPLQLRLQQQEWSTTNEREMKRAQHERARRGSEVKERAAEPMEVEMAENAQQAESAGNTAGAGNNAVMSEKETQKQQRMQE